MQNFTVTLATDANGDPALELKNVKLGFQGSPNNANSLNDGNMEINATQTAHLTDGSTLDSNFNGVSIRLKDLEAQIAAEQDPTVKTALQAKFDIWNACLQSIQTALATALKADYDLQKGGA